MARGVKAKAHSEFILSLVSIYLLININIGEAIWLEVPSSGTKCVSEDIKQNIVVIADFSVINDDNHPVTVPNISARVTSPYGNNLHHQENVTHGQFAFTTTEAGNYLACFWVDENYKGSKGVTVSLDWRTGIAAKDWESVARKEKIEGIELELRKLEGAVDAIHQNLIYLKTREAEMREVSETTNGRVAWFSIMSIGRLHHSFCYAGFTPEALLSEKEAYLGFYDVFLYRTMQYHKIEEDT